MNAPPYREFRLSPPGYGRGISCDASGAFIDSIPLLKRTLDNAWIPRDAAELSEALGAHYGLPIDTSSKSAGLDAIARALNTGDIAHAQLVTLHLQIPETPQLDKSASPHDDAISFVRGLDASKLLQKVWEPDDHPRWPAGSPDKQGGEFAPRNAEIQVADAEPDPEEPERDDDGQTEAESRANWAAAEAAGRAEDEEKATEAAGGETRAMSFSRINRLEFRRDRPEIWRNEGKKDPETRKLDSYIYSDSNLSLMRSGRAPIGNDGFPMELHHPDGDPDAPVEPMTRTEHRLGENYLRNHSYLIRPVKKANDIFAEQTNAKGTFACVFFAEAHVSWLYLYRMSPDGDHKIIDVAHVLNGAPDFSESDVEVRWFDNDSKVGVLIRNTLWAYIDVRSGRSFKGRYPTTPLHWPSQ